MKPAVWVAVFLSLPGPTARAIPPGEDGAATHGAQVALAALDLQRADRLLQPVAARHPDDPDVLAARSVLGFERGRYAEAVERMRRAVARGRPGEPLARRRGLLALMEATRDATARFVEAHSEDGRFVVMHAPGADGVLVPWALEALEAADEAVTAELGYRVPGPVRLEIYPTADSLAQVSALSLADIERTGTVALCKWDRLMITSPRALVHGYAWMDTLSHELVHLILTRASRDRAPVWFQEGVARFLERTWRGGPAAVTLDPAVDALLARAVRDGTLIPFDDLHPSIARLPSQRDAALAFAQVATFIQSFHDHHGAAGLRAAVRRIADGEDARHALAAVAGEPFSRLSARWRAELRSRPAPEAPPPRLSRLRLRRGPGSGDEASEAVEEGARRFLRLGDLLWERGRADASAREYEQAHRAAPDDPVVASRFGRAAIAAGRAAQAISALERVRQRYPDHAPILAVLGSALLAAGRAGEARDVLREAIWHNPFDPQPHCDLALAGADEAERSRAAEGCRLLGGTLR